jgi:adenylate cyclase
LERLKRWHQALGLFRARSWNAAQAGFEPLAHEKGYERLVQLYLGYIRDLQAKPPDPDWDASFTLYDK